MRPQSDNSSAHQWSTLENLYLISSVLRYGDQNWTDISQVLNKTLNTEHTYSFLQCSKQYEQLTTSFGDPIRIYDELCKKRLKEIDDPLKNYIEDLNKLYKEIEMIESGAMDTRLDQILEEMERKERGEPTVEKHMDEQPRNIDSNEKQPEGVTRRAAQLPTKAAPNTSQSDESKAVKIALNEHIDESLEDQLTSDDDVDMSPDTSGGCYITWKPDIATTPTNDDQNLKQHQTKKTVEDKRSSIEWKPVIDVSSEKLTKSADKSSSLKTLKSQETPKNKSLATTKTPLTTLLASDAPLIQAEKTQVEETQVETKSAHEAKQQESHDKDEEVIAIEVVEMTSQIETNENDKETVEKQIVEVQLVETKEKKKEFEKTLNTDLTLAQSKIETTTSKLNQMLNAPLKPRTTTISKKSPNEEESTQAITIENSSISSSDTVVSVKQEPMNELVPIENPSLLSDTQTETQNSHPIKQESKKASTTTSKKQISSIITELRKKKDEQTSKKVEIEAKPLETVVEAPKLETQESVPSSVTAKSEEEKAYKQWKKSVLMVVTNIMSHKHANVFMFPVKDDIAPGYSQIVYRPIDLTTIKKNIENGLTRTTKEVQRDVMLMFTNAIMYNSFNHDVYRIAREMYKEVIHHIELLHTRESMNSTQDLTLNVKSSRSKDTRLSVASDSKGDSTADISGSNESTCNNDKILLQLKTEEINETASNSGSGVSTPIQHTNTRKRRISSEQTSTQQPAKSIKRKRK